ncbi:hypothetical protein ACJJH9_00015 (plasmid) [Microbulbifer sp. DLAB2-AF]|uniref:hypothetical protein n=1 Tax=Microbulbifer sp. DLAB2-AF TaxID=3243395 RepID=UPI00403A24A7
MSDKYRFEIQGDDRTRPMFKRLQQNMRETNNASAVMQRGMRGASQGIAAVDGPLGGVSSRVSALNGLLTTSGAVWGVAGAAVAGYAAVMWQSVRSGEEMERGLLKIDALLKATGGSAGRTSQQLDEQARSVALNTLASIQGVRDAQGVLLTFKTVQTDVFDRAIELSHDLAAVMSTDAKGAALQLGKALEDPATGLSALKRAGVSFTETEREMIKEMQEAGRVAEAQNFILDKLGQQVGGTGSAEAQGLTGKVDTLGQTWTEFLEAVSETYGTTEKAGQGIDFLTDSVDALRRGIAATPDELARIEFNELHEKLVSHQHLLAKATKEGVAVQVEIQSHMVAKVKAQMAELQDAQIKKQKERQAKEQEAEQRAAEVAQAAQAERAAALLRNQQEKSSEQLAHLDQYLADEHGKLEIAHQKRLEQIANLNLAEQELKARGFDSIEALQASYIEREDSRFEAQLAALKEKQARIAGMNQEEEPSTDGLTEQERSQMTARLESLQMSWLTELEQLQVKQDQEYAIIDQAYANKIISHEDYERKLTLLEAKHAKEREKLDKATNKSRWQSLSGAMNTMLSISDNGSKKMFKVQKALSLANAIVTLPSAVIKSYENAGGYPWGIAPAAAMAAAGLAQISQIKSTNFSSGNSSVGSASAGGGSIASTPQQGASLNGINQFSNKEPEQPGIVLNFTVQGDLIGDNAQTIADQIKTLITEQDYELIEANTRQAQTISG